VKLKYIYIFNLGSQTFKDLFILSVTYKPFMMNVIMPSVVMLNVVIPSVEMLSVVVHKVLHSYFFLRNLDMGQISLCVSMAGLSSLV